MKFAHRSIIVLGVIVAAAFAGTQVYSQEKKPTAPPAQAEEPPVDHDMANMMPGPTHAKLGQYVGEFETTTTFSAPDMPPMEPSKGTASIKSMLDGRFFMDVTKGEMMGQPFESVHYYGYNNATGEYEANWTYTMSTSMLNLKGKSEDDGKTVVLKGAVREGDEEEMLVVTMAFVDDDNFSYSIATPDGDKGPVMKTAYSRKK